LGREGADSGLRLCSGWSVAGFRAAWDERVPVPVPVLAPLSAGCGRIKITEPQTQVGHLCLVSRFVGPSS
jgi:hypothetical protein